MRRPLISILIIAPPRSCLRRESSHQRIREAAHDPDPDVPARLQRRAAVLHVDDPVAGGPALALPLAVLALDEDLELAADEALVDLVLDAGLEVEQPLQARGGDLVGDLRLAAPPRRRRAGPRRVAEAEEAAEPDAPDERERLLEVLVRLPRKPDDEVRREGRGRARAPGSARPSPRTPPPCSGASCGAGPGPSPTAPAGAGRARSGRPRRARPTRSSSTRLGCEVMKRTRREPLDPPGAAQQLAEAEALLGIAVGVDRLAEQRDLRVTERGDVRELVEDLGRAAAALAAPRERDDAEGAELVAAFDDRDVSLEARLAGDLAELVDGVLGRQLQGERLAALAPRGGDELADLLDLAGARPRSRPRARAPGFPRPDTCATQPVTPTTRSGFSCLRRARTPSSLKTLASAFSRTEQVFRSTTPGSSPSAARRRPCDSSWPAMR